MKAVPIVYAAACLLFQASSRAGAAAAFPPSSRTVEWLTPVTPLSDIAALREEALRRLPATFFEFPADVELYEPRKVGAQTWLNGRYTVNGSEIIGSGFAMAFNERGGLFSFSRPVFGRSGLVSYPGPATVTPDEAASIAGRVAGDDATVRTCPLCYSVGLSRWVYSACISRALEPSAAARKTELWEPTALLIDGRTGEVFHKEVFSAQLMVSGTCRGTSLPILGPGVRRAYGLENHNVPEERPLPHVPLRLFQPGREESNPLLTKGDGGFEFVSAPDTLWGLKTFYDTIDFTLVSSEGTQVVSGESSGVGDRSLELLLGPQPTDDLTGENLTGVITGWIYLYRALRFAEMLQERNFLWPIGLGGRQEYIRGMPAFYRIQFVRISAENGTQPFVGGAYFDAFPPNRLIGISEANDLFHDWVSPAIWHEFGHAVVSAFTGQINDPHPNEHDATVEEFVADFFALLMMEHSDPSGEIPCVIGRGLERGYPDSFQRNVKAGQVCYAEPGKLVPCFPQEGYGIFPPDSEPHRGSLVFSGFFYDLWVRLAERYGREKGFAKIADTLVRYIDQYRGNKMAEFTLWTVMDIVTINDNPDLGGDCIPQNGSPDFDLIVDAAARHNLWLHPFSRGEVNQDGVIDVSDAIALLGYLFLGAAGPACLDAADTNDSGNVDLSDAVYLLLGLFGGRAAPVPPGGCDGLDPTPDDRLTCVSYSACNR